MTVCSLEPRRLVFGSPSQAVRGEYQRREHSVQERIGNSVWYGREVQGHIVHSSHISGANRAQSDSQRSTVGMPHWADKNTSAQDEDRVHVGEVSYKWVSTDAVPKFGGAGELPDRQHGTDEFGHV